MKTGLVAGVVAFLGVTSADVSADQPAYTTSWFFRVTYFASGQFTESRDPSDSAGVFMPTGSRWTCDRAPVTLSRSGLQNGGFMCSIGPNAISVTAVCNHSEPALDMAGVAIGDSDKGTAMRLFVQCVTRLNSVPTKAPAKSPTAIERNL